MNNVSFVVSTHTHPSIVRIKDIYLFWERTQWSALCALFTGHGVHLSTAAIRNTRAYVYTLVMVMDDELTRVKETHPEALERVCSQMEQINSTVQHLSSQAASMDTAMRSLERKLALLRTPFESSIYEVHCKQRLTAKHRIEEQPQGEAEERSESFVGTLDYLS